jgi:hypothetical protein
MDAMPIFLRRKDAAQYLRQKYGFSSEKSLSKLASVGGGPEFRRVGQGQRCIVLYEPSALDAWAQSKIGPPRLNTSE